MFFKKMIAIVLCCFSATSFAETVQVAGPVNLILNHPVTISIEKKVLPNPRIDYELTCIIRSPHVMNIFVNNNIDFGGRYILLNGRPMVGNSYQAQGDLVPGTNVLQLANVFGGAVVMQQMAITNLDGGNLSAIIESCIVTQYGPAQYSDGF